MNRYPLVSAIAVMCALTGCSTSAVHSGSTAPPPVTASPSSAATPSTRQASSSAGHPVDVAKLCSAVPQADVQKLLKQPAGPVTVNAQFSECSWQGGNITIAVHSHDDDLTVYNTIDTFQHHAPLTGVGDKAEWADDPTASIGTVPVVAAHKGALTLSLNAGPIDQTTLRYTGTQDTKIVVDPSSAAQYAAEEGQLCNDMFKGTG